MPYNERAHLPHRNPDQRQGSPRPTVPPEIIKRDKRRREQESNGPIPLELPVPIPPRGYEDPDDARKRQEREDPEKNRGVMIIDM